MKVRDAMTRGVTTAAPGDTVRQVAASMSEIDTGLIPVLDGEAIVGLITDRDIVIRVVAEGLGSDTPVSQVMTTQVETVEEGDSLDDAVERMADLQIRRVLVTGPGGALAGVLSLGDVAREAKAKETGHVLAEISEPGDEPAR